jgi:hypothetical protein
VPQLLDGAELALEADDRRRARLEDPLSRDLLFTLGVVHEVDAPHPAAPELADRAVARLDPSCAVLERGRLLQW